MQVSKVKSVWNGTLKEGKGTMNITGFSGPFSYATRFENAKGTNPEELVGAAHAGCYSMFLSALLSEEGLTPESIETEASVTLGEVDGGPAITHITLSTVVKCDGLSKEKFDELSVTAKEKCPISRLYQGGTADIELDAQLVE